MRSVQLGLVIRKSLLKWEAYVFDGIIGLFMMQRNRSYQKELLQIYVR